MAQNDPALLIRLRNSGLDFVIIGGVCVVYHGAPMATFDLDICCPFGEQNLRKIESALRDVNPVHRLTTQRLPLAATLSASAEIRTLYLQTDLGKLDCVSEIAGVGGFEEARRRSVLAGFSYGEFRFLSLEALIAAKQALGRERDLQALRLLRAIHERKTGGQPRLL
jgi:hypothetical protein